MTSYPDPTMWMLLQTALDEGRAADFHHCSCARIRLAYAQCTCTGPGDLLAMCSMRRTIVATHGYPTFDGDALPWCRICSEPEDRLDDRVAQRWPCIAMRALLGSMTSRPGFQQTWLDMPMSPKAAAIYPGTVPVLPAPRPLQAPV